MDCEMVGLGPLQESGLARCSLVSSTGSVLYDKFIRPEGVITDYRTRVSGVTRLHMETATPFAEARREVSQGPGKQCVPSCCPGPAAPLGKSPRSAAGRAALSPPEKPTFTSGFWTHGQTKSHLMLLHRMTEATSPSSPTLGLHKGACGKQLTGAGSADQAGAPQIQGLREVSPHWLRAAHRLIMKPRFPTPGFPTRLLF